MANNCYYQAQVTGKAKDIHELISMMRWQGEYKQDGLGRIFDVSCTSLLPYPDKTIIAFIEGDCAWSIMSSMIKCGSRRNLLTESKSLNLRIEMYSEELGFGFQEHIVIDHGDLIVNDEVDITRYDLAELSPEEIEEICKENHLKHQELMDQAEDGIYTIDGFKNWIFVNPPKEKDE